MQKMKTRPPFTPPPAEQGYLLVAVIFMMAILIISMAVALPKVRESIQRDRDLETMHRGKQYIRAIQLYYRKFNAYPPNVDALVKTNEIRFLRKKYIDPTTGKDEWKPVLFGQNKTPTAMGFFGQPLAGSTLAGIGPSGGNGLNGANGQQGNGLGSAFGNNSGSAFGNNSSSAFGNNSNSAFGSNSNSAFGNNSNSAFGSNNGVAGANGANGSPTNGAGSTDGSSGSNGSGSSSAFGGPGNGQTGQTFGGAGIIGFSPGSPKQSIYVYKKKNHYNEWEFTYDPAQERMMMMGGGGGNGLGQPGAGTGTGAIPGAPLTNTPVFGNPVPTGPTNPTTPQQ